MFLLKHLLRCGDDPLEPLFWFVTSIAVLVSGATACPINSWPVARGVKHGMMSGPEPGVSAMDMGGTGMKAIENGVPQHEGHDTSGMKHESHGGKPLSLGQQVGIIVGTSALLVLVLVIVGQFMPIRFS